MVIDQTKVNALVSRIRADNIVAQKQPNAGLKYVTMTELQEGQLGGRTPNYHGLPGYAFSAHDYYYEPALALYREAVGAGLSVEMVTTTTGAIRASQSNNVAAVTWLLMFKGKETLQALRDAGVSLPDAWIRDVSSEASVVR